MNKDPNVKKQIKKVSKERQEYLKLKPFADDLRKAESWCDLDGVLNRYQTVKNLSKMGYRKASEVVREIFEEIDEIIDKNTYKSYLPNSSLWSKGYKISQIIEEIAELKKKYIGKDTNVTNNTEE